MDKFTDLSNYAVVVLNFIVWLCGIFETTRKTKKTVTDTLNNKLDEKLKGLYDDNRRQYRYQICDFAGDLHNGVVKTREEFQAIFGIIDRYEDLVDKLKQKNHFADNEIAYIEEKYRMLETGGPKSENK